MDMLMAGVGTLMNALFLAMIVAAVMKLFQIHTTLTEIKEQLGKTPAPQPSYAPPAYAQPTQSHPSYTAPAPAPAQWAPQPATAQPATTSPTLRMTPPSAPPPPVVPMVGDTRSGEELLRELDAQMRFEDADRR